MKKKILITGSEGLMGKIIRPYLTERYSVFGLDTKKASWPGYFRADITAEKDLEKVFQKLRKLDLVIHLAAETKVQAPWQSVLEKNIIGTRNIYELARSYKVPKVIFASSNHITGAYEGWPPSLHQKRNPKKLSFKDPIRPDSYYAVSKACGEALARFFYEFFGIGSICLRIGSVLKDDTPTSKPRIMKTWLSHRDLIQLIDKSINARIGFSIYYGVSNNTGRFWDISNARKELDYQPEDNAKEIIDLH